MGRDLKAHQVQLGRESLRRVMAPRFRVPPTAPPGRPAKATLPRRRRRSSRLRPLLGLLPIVLLLVGLQSGVVSEILQEALVKGTDASASSTRSAGSAGGPGVVAPPQAAAKPALLSCSSLDVSRLKYVKNSKLVAKEQVGGCQWSLVSGKGSSQKPIKVLRIKEDTERFGLSPLIKRSRREQGAGDLQGLQHLRSEHVGLGCCGGSTQGSRQDRESHPAHRGERRVPGTRTHAHTG